MGIGRGPGCSLSNKEFIRRAVVGFVRRTFWSEGLEAASPGQKAADLVEEEFDNIYW